MIGGSSLPRRGEVLLPFFSHSLPSNWNWGQREKERENSTFFLGKEHFCLRRRRPLSVPWLLGSPSPFPSLPPPRKRKELRAEMGKSLLRSPDWKSGGEISLGRRTAGEEEEEERHLLLSSSDHPTRSRERKNNSPRSLNGVPGFLVGAF